MYAVKAQKFLFILLLVIILLPLASAKLLGGVITVSPDQYQSIFQNPTVVKSELKDYFDGTFEAYIIYKTTKGGTTTPSITIFDTETSYSKYLDDKQNSNFYTHVSQELIAFNDELKQNYVSYKKGEKLNEKFVRDAVDADFLYSQFVRVLGNNLGYKDETWVLQRNILSQALKDPKTQEAIRKVINEKTFSKNKPKDEIEFYYDLMTSIHKKITEVQNSEKDSSEEIKKWGEQIDSDYAYHNVLKKLKTLKNPDKKQITTQLIDSRAAIKQRVFDKLNQYFNPINVNDANEAKFETAQLELLKFLAQSPEVETTAKSYAKNGVNDPDYYVVITKFRKTDRETEKTVLDIIDNELKTNPGIAFINSGQAFADNANSNSYLVASGSGFKTPAGLKSIDLDDLFLGQGFSKNGVKVLQAVHYDKTNLDQIDELKPQGTQLYVLPIDQGASIYEYETEVNYDKLELTLPAPKYILSKLKFSNQFDQKTGIVNVQIKLSTNNAATPKQLTTQNEEQPLKSNVIKLQTPQGITSGDYQFTVSFQSKQLPLKVSANYYRIEGPGEFNLFYEPNAQYTQDLSTITSQGRYENGLDTPVFTNTLANFAYSSAIAKTHASNILILPPIENLPVYQLELTNVNEKGVTFNVYRLNTQNEKTGAPVQSISSTSPQPYDKPIETFGYVLKFNRPQENSNTITVTIIDKRFQGNTLTCTVTSECTSGQPQRVTWDITPQGDTQPRGLLLVQNDKTNEKPGAKGTTLVTSGTCVTVFYAVDSNGRKFSCNTESNIVMNTELVQKTFDIPENTCTEGKAQMSTAQYTMDDVVQKAETKDGFSLILNKLGLVDENLRIAYLGVAVLVVPKLYFKLPQDTLDQYANNRLLTVTAENDEQTVQFTYVTKIGDDEKAKYVFATPLDNYLAGSYKLAAYPGRPRDVEAFSSNQFGFCPDSNFANVLADFSPLAKQKPIPADKKLESDVSNLKEIFEPKPIELGSGVEDPYNANEVEQVKEQERANAAFDPTATGTNICNRLNVPTNGPTLDELIQINLRSFNAHHIYLYTRESEAPIATWIPANLPGKFVQFWKDGVDHKPLNKRGALITVQFRDEKDNAIFTTCGRLVK